MHAGDQDTAQGVIVVKGSGGAGLGDRIRALLVGLLYARLAKRQIYVDWSDGALGPPGVNVFPMLFDIHGLTTVSELPNTKTTVNPQAWYQRLHYSLHEVYVQDGDPPWDRNAAIARYSCDLSNLHHRESVLVVWEFDQIHKLRHHLPSAWSTLNDEQLLAKIYQQHLRPHASIIEQVQICFNGVQTATIGVHVRSTLEATKQKGSIALADYHRVLNRLVRTVQPERILLSTDNQQVEKIMRHRYQQIWSRPKWFAEAGQPLHLNPDCPDKLTALRDALVEILMLAQCDYLLSMRNSSFSIVARIASLIPAEHHFIMTANSSFKSHIKRLLFAQ